MQIYIIGAAQLQWANFAELKKEFPHLKLTLVHSDQEKIPHPLQKSFNHCIAIPGALKSESYYYFTSEMLISFFKKNPPENNSSFVTCCESNVSAVAHLNDLYQSPGLSGELAERYLDKTLMKQYVHAAGLRCPKHIRLGGNTSNKKSPDAVLKEITESLACPFILKPRADVCSVGISLIKSKEQFHKWYQENETNIDAYEAEEYITGELYHCDQIFQNQKRLFYSVSKYTHPCMLFAEGKTLGSRVLDDKNPLAGRIASLAHRVIAAIGHFDGCSHMEFFVTPNDEIIFLEVGARPPGGQIAPMIKASFGVNVVNLHIALSCGLVCAGPINQTLHAYSCWGYCYASKGGYLKPVKPENYLPKGYKSLVPENQRFNAPKCISHPVGQFLMVDTAKQKILDVFKWARDYSPSVVSSL